ncbi:histidinol phosphatase [Halostagnicola larsenii XH-48]|uniref:Histidinol phosphatase n=1 Tax=Halostagnicola larsenii XH-48 TaxID=797299 RepID=W0JIB8_9EURY|nr:PHP domain-containing protein [Halostagnicola larsenii]AHF98333.1 histidinol phosphatase [Halostagnicola larsenii XH-48]
MPYADLHVHTTRSDGGLELEAVPEAARRNDVEVVAVTDHDRRQPFEESVIERDGVTIVHGIELRVETADGLRVDLLGYGLEPTPALESTLEAIQTNRRERGQAIVDRVEDRLGVDLGVTVDDGFGRPHVARAVADHPDTEYDYEATFNQLIGGDGPCFVPREIPSFERGQQLLSEAATIVSLAHPLRYPDSERALELTADLDAVELHYPYGAPVDIGPVERAISTNDLRITGGTDAHDDRLGVAGLTAEEYHELEISR